jgi:3-vinyl bacteriochlorophyllide hydratase
VTRTQTAFVGHSLVAQRAGATRTPLYTDNQRARRDSTRWTLVQAILAPLQLLACLISAALIWRFLATGEGAQAATISVLVKCGLLFAIMVTGAIWEKVVFGRYLFAPAFFWEDVVSMGVVALHAFYLWAWLTGWGDDRARAHIALAAYAAYSVNAAQFLWKLRRARLDAASAGAAT